jgi:hypothetical protein
MGYFPPRDPHARSRAPPQGRLCAAVLAQPRKRTAGRNRLDISNDLFPEDLAGELRAARPHHWQTEARFLA